MTNTTAIILGIWFFTGMAVHRSNEPIWNFFMGGVAIVTTVVTLILSYLFTKG